MPLYVVATPIGNLQDVSPRALEILRAVDAIVAEDTRHTRGLLTHFDIHKPLLSLPAFDERARVEPLVARLAAGESFALVTDAGTPGISDPGEALVDAAWTAGVTVQPVPGPSAALAALSASGLPTSRFVFTGFLPRQGQSRRDALAWVLRTGETTVIFEAGNRLGDTLGDLLDALGDRRALVARELTKLHEELVRGTLSSLAAQFREGARGEVVLVIEGGTPPDEVELAPLDEEIRRRLNAGESVRDIASALATAYALPRQEVYSRTLQLRNEGA
jgi:16S rRNA (cytidine1402-2'-O)-methyltransferase